MGRDRGGIGRRRVPVVACEGLETRLCRAATTAPDLSVSEVYVWTAFGGAAAVPEFEAGTSHGVVVSLVQDGVPAADGPSPGAVAAVYLSADGALSTDDMYLGTAGDGTGAWGGAPMVFPATIPTGTYYLIAVADPQNVVTERDETNNVTVGRQVTVHAPYGPPPASYVPVFENVTISGAPYTPGGHASLSVYMYGFDQYYHIPVQLWLSPNGTAGDADDIPLGSLEVTRYDDPYGETWGMGGPRGRGEADVTLPAGLAAGAYRLVATAANATPLVGDAVDVIRPADGVDLAFYEPELGQIPTADRGGTFHSAAFEVENLGAGASGRFRVGLYLSADDRFDPATDVRVPTGDEYGVPEVGGASMVMKSVQFYTPNVAGTFYPILVADPDDWVAELDETNNVLIGRPITITPTPVDVAPASVWVAGPDGEEEAAPVVAAGGSVTVGASVNFSGARAALRYALSADDVAGNADDIVLGTYPAAPDGTPPVWGDQAVRGAAFRVPASVRSGTYRLVVTADPDDQVAEADETNNSVVGPAVTVVTPELAASLSTVKVAASGAKGAASLVLRNPGAAVVSHRYAVTLYISDDPALTWDDVAIGSRAVAANVGGRRSARVPLTYTLSRDAHEGARYLIAVADVKGATGGGKMRLEAVTPLQVAAPRLTASVVSVRPGTRAGHVRVTIRVSNPGVVAFSGLAHVQVRRSDMDWPDELAGETRKLIVRPGKHVDLTMDILRPADGVVLNANVL